MKQKQFKSLSDEELVSRTREGDSDALDFLITKYKNIVRHKAKSYFLIGADRDDIVQEGMIGLYKGIRDFKEDRQVSFKVFAELCITRQIITAIKTATRQKHIPLNSSVSLDKPISDEEQSNTLMDLVSVGTSDDPQEMMVHRERFDFMEERIETVLSSFEKQVLALYLDDCTYQEMSLALKKDVKSIDNALQRIKRKLEQHILSF
ncbi:RNA polymerase sporulation sigma factor SigH [Kurthia sibirica]|uniref:RNA polymerase sigma factor SigS n=1 Tax=Kurthia sibirica TaxID=202750 RepID=A0A2U3AMI6_9BACL|nr:RNA polymerase sporulation sigma factor SigH [Kurthia sibirica]PWI25748.1 RNA polymerase sporulation sigma factor SigH [Kurthia sibirica]